MLLRAVGDRANDGIISFIVTENKIKSEKLFLFWIKDQEQSPHAT